MDINVYMFHHIPMAYLERRALHPHTCCGLLITQEYIQMLWFFIHQSCMKLVIMRLCMGIQTQNMNCSVKKMQIHCYLVLVLPNKCMQEDVILSLETWTYL